MIKNKIQTYWNSIDFFLNKALWINIGIEYSVPIRIKNLLDIHSIFNEKHVEFFLEGRTLDSIFNNYKLPLVSTKT